MEPLPPSPGSSPPQLEDCIEDLLRFTLVLSLEGKIISGLSVEYSAHLLRDDPLDTLPVSNGFEGVPSYPLYKRLAFSLCKSICFGVVLKEQECNLEHKGSILIEKDGEWSNLIAEKGFALLNMLKEVDFELHVQEPFFTRLNDGAKTVEGRCAVGDYRRIKSEHILLFNKCLMLQVQDVKRYASFHEMLEAEGLNNVLPGVSTIEEGVRVYRNFYSEEKESLNGVLAISVQKPSSQIHTAMGLILSELGYDGVQRFLGLGRTVGTNPESLPPPRSCLLKAFLQPHNPDVKGSSLTCGARALAKHANRSMERYWSAMHGDDSEKNKHALAIVSHLLTKCCWLNLHIVPPHGEVLEIRNRDGYGARWSADGAKFIGFLEPYTAEGHSANWKH